MNKSTASMAVRQMRDEFLSLVTAYNAVGLYENAHAAQAMAIMLHKFEDAHNLMDMAWPADIINDHDSGIMIVDTKGNGIPEEEL